MLGEEHFIKDLEQEGYRSLGKMLQAPVRDTIRARRLVDIETADSFLDRVRVG